MADELRAVIRTAIEEAEAEGEIYETFSGYVIEYDNLAARIERAVRQQREQGMPDQFEPPIRQGESVPEHLYDGSAEMHGARAGRPIGTMLRSEWAEQIVEAVNGLAELEAERAQLQLELTDLPGLKLTEDGWLSCGGHLSDAKSFPRIAALLRPAEEAEA